MGRLAEIGFALSDGNRLRILCVLREGERCVCDVWRFLGLSQNLVSHHLKTLRDAGLIVSRKDGLKVLYSLNREALDGYVRELGGYVRKDGRTTRKK
ncbi:helix-turn-helix transcriptional regulator [Candidatus Uhrbacteria bacterium]|nr:helix-turn-helix transcriptional regulator [Candidatus Uhrbacteria bacterium]